MKKCLRSGIVKFILSLFALGLNFFAACEIGLGESVDVEAPKIEFANETVVSGAVIRDAFAVFGTWEDDGSIETITATLRSLTDSDFSIEREGDLDEENASWKVTFDPVREKISDGPYELSIYIEDSAGHENKISRSITIDNTAPLVVLSRPSTKAGASSFDSYGQKFTLEGKAADDNDVSLIEVNVYSNAACTGEPIKTITLPNVPLTIETDVAEYSSKTANDYSVIYGQVDASGIARIDGGDVERYCKLVVYDGAQRYPANGSAQSAEDKKGNSVEHYYLSKDKEIADLFTAGYKITELYHILNGTYSASGSRSVSTSGVTTLLNDPNKQIAVGQFRLNPQNSPKFVVSARNKLENGQSLSDMPLTNGNSQLEVELTPGLDGHIILEDTIGIYLVKCDEHGNPIDANGNPATVNTSNPKASTAKIIWLIEKDKHAQQAIITESGSSYKFKTVNNISVDNYNGLVVGDNYYVGVEGKDIQGNDFLNNGIYGFQLITSGKNIEVGVKAEPEWLSTNPAASNASKSLEVTLTYSTENKPFNVFRGIGTGTPDTTPLSTGTGVQTSPFVDTLDTSTDLASEPSLIVYKLEGDGGAVSNVKQVSLKYDDNLPKQPTITVFPNINIADPDSLTFQGKAEDNTNGSGIENVYVQLWNGKATDEASATVKTAELKATYSAAGKDWLFVMQKDSNDTAISNAFKTGGVFATEGQKTIKIISEDKVGLTNTQTQEFIYDKAKPVVKITGSQLKDESFVYTVPEIAGKTITLEGTITEEYGIKEIKIEQTKDGGSPVSRTITATGSNWTSPVLPFDTDISNHTADGTYTYKITVTDLAGKTGFVEKTITLNTKAPTITPKAPAFNSGVSDWQLSKNVMISGTASSPATITGIYYKVLTASDQTPIIPDDPMVDTNWTNGGWESASGTTNWAFTANAQDSASNKVYIAAVDNVGNVTDVTELTLKVDSSSPDFGALYYNFSGTEIYKKAEGQVYVDNSKSLIVYGKYHDGESGVTALTFNSKVKPTTIKYSTDQITGEETAASVKGLSYSITDITAANSTQITYWQATFTGFAADKVGEVKASGKNNAGGDTGEQKLFNISYDDKKPAISNVSFTTSAEAPYQVYKKDASNYWVNNQAPGAVFTVAGVATDNFGVESIKLTLDDVEQPIKSGSSVSEWEYELSLSSYSETAAPVVKIVATDVAGKDSDEESFTIHFDQTKPSPKHQADAKNKDIYFRIGKADNDTIADEKDKDVGSKYSFGSYGNDSTIEIRGTFEEKGAGLKNIYYKIYNTSVPPAADLTKLRNGQLPDGCKEFAPLASPDKKRVYYNIDTNGTKTSMEVESNYRVSLPGFDADNNYLVLIAEDNVGNRQFDELKLADGTNTWNSADNTATSYFNLNKDTTVPNIETDEEFKQGVFTNGFTDVTITGTASDEDAGLNKVTVSIDEKYTLSGTTYTVKYDAEIEAPLTNDKWSFTIPASTFPKELSGKSITAYITAIDSAGVGNKKQATANIIIDTTSPSVTVNTPSDADTSTDAVDVNGTIQLSGNADDDYGIEKVLGIYYTAAASYSTADLAKASINGATVWNKGISYKANDKVYVESEKKYYSCKTAHTAGEDFDSTKWNAIAWVKLADTTSLTDANAKTAWTFQNIVTSKLDGATTITDETEVWLTVAVLDKAGNIGVKPLQVKVDQNTDRPVVQFTNLSEVEGKYILKYGTDSQIEGKLSDDDAAGEVVNTFIISSTNLTTAPSNGTGGWTKTTSGNTITWSHATCGKTEYNKATGDYTYTPAVKADGAKEVYFYIKDNAGKEFYTAHTATLNQPYQQYKQEAKADNDTKLEYRSDGTSPVISDVKILVIAKWSDVKAEKNATDSYYTDEELTTKATALTNDDTTVYGLVSPGTGTVVGGKTKSTIKFIVKAKDDNGIKDMSLTGIKASALETDSSFTKTTDDTPATWKTDEIDLTNASFVTGSVNLAITVHDQCDLSANSSYVFMIDKDGPEINITSPKSGDEITGKFSISGISTDNGSAGAASIDFIVPTSAQRNSATTVTNYYKNLPDSSWGGKLHGDSTVSAFRYDFDGDTTNENALFDIYTKDDTNSTYGLIPNDNGIYTVPVVFRSKDSLGNVSIKEYSITYNPDGDKPKTEITYPSSANYQKDEHGNSLGFVTLGGEIRVTGSVSIPSLTTTPEKVYLQIAAGNTEAAFAAGKTKAGTGDGNYGYTVKSIINEGTASAPVYKIDSTTISGITGTAASNWWGIEAKRSSNAWSINLNSNSKMNPSGATTNNIYIRACGVNAEGKMGSWSEPVCIHIDASAPKYTQKLYQFTNDTPAFDDNAKPTGVSAEKDYTPGIFLKGQWFLGLEITDEDSIVIESVKNGNNVLTVNTDYKTKDTTYQENSNTYKRTGLLIKLNSSATSTLTYLVSARDDPENGAAHPINPTYEINIDNTPPELSAIKSDAGYPIAKTKQRTSNKVITFGATAEDSGSGFSRLAYYIKRGTGNSATVEIPLPELVDAANKKWKPGTAYKSTALSTLDGENVDDVNGEDLYGKELSGTKGEDDDGNTTFTSADISSYKFIRKGGLVKMAGTWHLIKGVSGTTVTINGKIDTDVTSAFFPIAFIVDNNTVNESSKWNEGINEIKNDDGDGIVETINKSGSTWTWDTSIYAGELDDGEVTLVCVAFDVAENAAKSETTFMLTNKTPRLSKLYLATDLNGDGKYSDNELGTSVITANGAKTVEKYYSALNAGSLQEVFTVYGNEDDTKNSKTTSGITMRNNLGIAFEFVGVSDGYEGYGAGQGALKYQLSVSQDKITAAEPGIDGALVEATNTYYDDTDNTLTKTLIGNKFLSVPTSKFRNGNTVVEADGTYREYLTSGETGYNSTENYYLNYLNVTLWDSSKNGNGTPDGTKTTNTIKDNNGNDVEYDTYESFGDQWTAFNIPLYMDLVDGVKPTVEIDNPVALGTTDAPEGHVDLKATITTKTPFTVTNTTTSGEFDDDDKVSGKIVFTGTAKDEKRIITLSIKSNYEGSEKTYDVAEYDNGVLKVKTSPTTALPTGLTFTIESNNFSIKDGHTVEWKLVVDTAKVQNGAKADVSYVVIANDGTSDGSKTHKVDIVPYITNVQRTTTTTDTHRSKLGKYQTVINETLSVEGFNLPITEATTGTINGYFRATTGNVKATTATVANKITSTGRTVTGATLTVPGSSGYVVAVTNGILSLNNMNDNSQENNKQTGEMATSSDVWSDDVYLSAWKNDEYFSGSPDPISPAMDRIAANKKNNTYNANVYTLYGGWAANSSKFFASYPDSTSTAATGNATAPSTGNFGDPASYYDVVIDSSGNLYHCLLDCWQGQNGNGQNYQRGYWGRNFVINKNGSYTHNNTDGSTNATTDNIIERMGWNTLPEYETHVNGYDAMFNQFLNPRITYKNNYAYLTYYDRYAKCLKFASMQFNANGNNRTNKYSTEAGNYTNGKYVVAGYETLQSGGTKSAMDVGIWSSIVVDSETGKTDSPVIAYYDTKNKQLMIATANTRSQHPENSNNNVLANGTTQTVPTGGTTPGEGNAWNQIPVPNSAGYRLGQYVSMAIDGEMNLHIAAYGTAKGNKLYYIYGAKNSYGDYTFTTTIVDEENAGTWTDIQLEAPGESGAAAKPVISYYDPSNDSSENAVKVAYLDGGVWDTMTAPLASSAVSNRITLALDVTDGDSVATATSNNSKLAIGYVSSRFDCVYLRKE